MTTQAAKRARLGVIGLFWLNGAGWSSLFPRYPEIQNALHISNGWWGVVVGMGTLGGMVAGLFTAHLMRRYSSANVAVVAQVIGIAMLLAIGTSPWVWLLSLSMFLMAGLDALSDIAMNSHGLRVQREYGRSILNSFHGWWSIGAVSGGLIGATCAQLKVPLVWQCLGAAIVFGGMSIATRLLLLPGPDSLEEEASGHTVLALRKAPPRIVWRLLALGLLGGAIGSMEDVGASWSAIYLTDVYHALPFVAGLGFVALQGMQTIGRLTGDRVVDKVGAYRAVVWGAMLSGGGMLLSLLVGNVWVALIGFGCVGLGIAVGIPMAMNAADELPGLAPGVGLTVVSWLLRLGFIVSAPVIGALGELLTLRWALILIPVAAAFVIALAPALKPITAGGSASDKTPPNG